MKQPAIDIVISLVRTGIEDGTWPQGSRLPTVSRLAEIARVSRDSVLRAIARLKKDGVVSTVRRGRITVGPPVCSVQDADSSAPVQPRWKQVKTRIYRDILDGYFSPSDSIGPAGVLLERYGTSYPVLRSALQGLQEDGVIRRYKRRYRIVRNQAGVSGRSRIFLISINESSPLFLEVPRILETQAHQHDIGVSTYSMRETSAQTIRQRLKDIRPLGVLFWLTPRAAHRKGVWDNLLSLIRSTASAPVPVIVFDELGDKLPHLGSAFTTRKNCIAFMQAAASAGERVGKALLAAGHTRAAFFHWPQSPQWVRDRYAGLVRAFGAAGYDHAVRAVEPLVDCSFREAAMAVGELEEAEYTRLFEMFPSSLYAVKNTCSPERFREIRDILHKRCFNTQVWEEIRLCVRALRDFAFSYGDTPIAGGTQISEGYFWSMDSRTISLMYQPLFEQALEDPGCTAWVGSNDRLAVEAARFLEQNGRDGMTLFGFGNTERAARLSIGTYDFGAHHIVSVLLSHILNPRLIRHSRKERTPVEIPGLVIDRHAALNKREKKGEGI